MGIRKLIHEPELNEKTSFFLHEISISKVKQTLIDSTETETKYLNEENIPANRNYKSFDLISKELMEQIVKSIEDTKRNNLSHNKEEIYNHKNIIKFVGS